MAPAYGGMFRPPPQRRVGVIIAGVVVVVVFFIAGVASAVFLWQRHNRFAENGRPCAGTCANAKCVHDPGDSYCATECASDGDCPSAFVCDPTLSGRHHVCLKAGVHRRSRGR